MLSNSAGRRNHLRGNDASNQVLTVPSPKVPTQSHHALRLQVILPELWDTAVDLFDASRAGVVSDRKRTQKVQEKVRCVGPRSSFLRFASSGGSNFKLIFHFAAQVMNKYLKRKYRELKMYVKNGWWGYARPVPRSGRQDGNLSDSVKLLPRRYFDQLTPAIFNRSQTANFVVVGFMLGVHPPRSQDLLFVPSRG